MVITNNHNQEGGTTPTYPGNDNLLKEYCIITVEFKIPPRGRHNGVPDTRRGAKGVQGRRSGVGESKGTLSMGTGKNSDGTPATTKSPLTADALNNTSSYGDKTAKLKFVNGDIIFNKTYVILKGGADCPHVLKSDQTVAHEDGMTALDGIDSAANNYHENTNGSFIAVERGRNKAILNDDGIAGTMLDDFNKSFPGGNKAGLQGPTYSPGVYNWYRLYQKALNEKKVIQLIKKNRSFTFKIGGCK